MTEKTQNYSVSKINLNEISFMRPILAVLIVLMHSFTVYQGSWEPIPGIEQNRVYGWITWLAFAGTLETFVFISGYLFAFQRITLKRDNNLWSFIKKKFPRLLIPGITFSLLWLLAFEPNKLTINNMTLVGGGKLCLELLNGTAHMWFLPMLFWCYILAYFIVKIPVNDVIKLLSILVLDLLPIPVLPIRISFYYLFFFFLGYLIYQYRDWFIKNITTKRLILIWCVFIVAFPILRLNRDTLCGNMLINSSMLTKVFVIGCRGLCKVICASLSLFAIYATSVWYTQRHQLSQNYVKFGTYCFGIYIWQQFILWQLYYHTELPQIAGQWLMPWIGFSIALLLSFVMAKVCKEI